MSLYIKIDENIQKETVESIRIHTTQGNHSIPSCILVMGDCPEYFIARDEMLDCVNEEKPYIYSDKVKKEISNNLEDLTNLFVPVVKNTLDRFKDDIYYGYLDDVIQEGTNLNKKEIEY